MLKRAENVSLTHHPSLLTGNGWLVLHVGRATHRLAKMHKSAAVRAKEQSATVPVRLVSVGERTYYRFQGKFYTDNDGLSVEQVHALLVSRGQRESARIERAQAIVAIGEQRRPVRRGVIPDDVKHLVYTRDGGRCVHCGTPHEIQYDHVIPVKLGGSSEPENLQLLCGPCNRRKGAGLTVR